MFWLGYLYKKIAQNNCETQVKFINEKGYDVFKKDQLKLKMQIETMCTREAKRTR